MELKLPFIKNLNISAMSIENGWFYESETMWDGLNLVLDVRCRPALWFKSEGSAVS